jgi:hypothetical protein
MTLGKTERLYAAGTASAVLLRIILGELQGWFQHRRSLRARLRYGSVTDFAPLDCAASGLMELRSTGKTRLPLRSPGVYQLRYAERQ